MIDNPALRERTTALFPFFAALSPEQQRELWGAAVQVHIPAGHPVCHEGAQCSHLALLLGGTARVYKLGENGRDITLYRVRPGQSCILTASCILSGLAFPAIAVCEEAAEAVLLAAPLVRKLTAGSDVFRGYVFGLMAQRLGNLVSVLEDVAFRRLDQRLAAYLGERAASTGTLLQTTHQEIASDLGTSREVISRLLKDLEGRGLVRTARGSLELSDPVSLARLAETSRTG